MPTNPYTTQTISNYNNSPPPDDGTTTSANQLEWAKHKTKLADPIKTLAENINSQNLSAFAKTINTDADEANQIQGSLAFARSELTLATTDAITPTRTMHTVDTNADAASDDLAVLATGSVSDGAWVALLAENSARRVTVLDSGVATATAANITLNGGQSVDLDTNFPLLLRHDAGTFYEWLRPQTAAKLGKNLIINGAMTVAQRGTQSSVASGFGATDRWKMNSLGGASARYTISQESNGGVRGNAKWSKILVTTADASPGANEGHYYGQQIEGQNAQALLDDSGDLKASTLSFDVIVHADGASSITFPATLAICVNDNGFGNNQQFVKTFTVAAADTWERVSVAIPANASAVIDDDNTDEFQVSLTIYSGTGRETTDNTWESAAGLDISVSGVVNLADAANNYLGVTEVQLEPGSVATDFEHEDIGETLRKCKRRYRRYSGVEDLGVAFCISTSVARVWVPFEVEMAGVPTLGISAANGMTISYSGGTSASTAIVLGNNGASTFGATVNVTGTGTPLTAGQAAYVEIDSGDYLEFDSEL